MLLEDWETVRKASLPRTKEWVKDNQLHAVFLTRSASTEVTANQLSEQLGYTVLAENLKTRDGSPWTGQWFQHQVLFIEGFWRRKENQRQEKFNVNRLYPWRDACEQLRRLELNSEDYEVPTAMGTGIVLLQKVQQPIDPISSISEEASADTGYGSDFFELPSEDEIPVEAKVAQPPEQQPDPPEALPPNQTPAKLIIKGQMWPVGDPQTDLFEEVRSRTGAR
jgi:hypothetical protein